MSGEALHELKKCFLEAYDENNDGKIDIREGISGNQEYTKYLGKHFKGIAKGTADPAFACFYQIKN